MGAFSSNPICEKESEDREGVLNYGASAMQGWHLSQEVKSESRKTGLCSVGISVSFRHTAGGTAPGNSESPRKFLVGVNF